MERDELSRTQPRDTSDSDEVRRNDALARYDAHPGVAIWLLAGMAFLFIVATYQFITDRVRPRHSERQRPDANTAIDGAQELSRYAAASLNALGGGSAEL